MYIPNQGGCHICSTFRSKIRMARFLSSYSAMAAVCSKDEKEHNRNEAIVIKDQIAA